MEYNYTNPIWFKKPSILLENSSLNEFMPTPSMDYTEKLNAIMRFSIYLTLIIYIYNRNYKIIYLILVTACFTYFIYYFKNTQIKKITELGNIFENFKYKNGTLFFPKKIDVNKDTEKKCKAPQDTNPFMNRLIYDDKNPNMKNCPYYAKSSEFSNWDKELINKNPNTTIKDIVEDKFNKNLYKNVEDIFNRNNSQRQYYTTPVTSLVNEQTNFAKWLYNTPVSCKDGNGNQCVANNPNIVNAKLENLNLRYY